MNIIFLMWRFTFELFTQQQTMCSGIVSRLVIPPALFSFPDQTTNLLIPTSSLPKVWVHQNISHREGNMRPYFFCVQDSPPRSVLQQGCRNFFVLLREIGQVFSSKHSPENCCPNGDYEFNTGCQCKSFYGESTLVDFQLQTGVKGYFVKTREGLSERRGCPTASVVVAFIPTDGRCCGDGRRISTGNITGTNMQIKISLHPCPLRNVGMESTNKYQMTS